MSLVHERAAFFESISNVKEDNSEILNIKIEIAQNEKDSSPQSVKTRYKELHELSKKSSITDAKEKLKFELKEPIIFKNEPESSLLLDEKEEEEEISIKFKNDHISEMKQVHSSGSDSTDAFYSSFETDTSSIDTITPQNAYFFSQSTKESEYNNSSYNDNDNDNESINYIDDELEIIDESKYNDSLQEQKKRKAIEEDDLVTHIDKMIKRREEYLEKYNLNLLTSTEKQMLDSNKGLFNSQKFNKLFHDIIKLDPLTFLTKYVGPYGFKNIAEHIKTYKNQPIGTLEDNDDITNNKHNTNNYEGHGLKEDKNIINVNLNENGDQHKKNGDIFINQSFTLIRPSMGSFTEKSKKEPLSEILLPRPSKPLSSQSHENNEKIQHRGLKYLFFLIVTKCDKKMLSQIFPKNSIMFLTPETEYNDVISTGLDFKFLQYSAMIKILDGMFFLTFVRCIIYR